MTSDYSGAVKRLIAGEAPMTSFSGNFEDVILARVFEGQDVGFYVDVGAHHPTNASNTYHFSQLGWRGINIEPSRSFSDFPSARPNDVNLKIAVSDVECEVQFEECEDLLAISQLKSATAMERTMEHLNRDTVSVSAKTLTTVLGEHLPEGTTIDFMSIDVEGHERQVIASNDWQAYRPRVLCIEATLPFTNELCHGPWEPLLTAANYTFAYFDGVNRFYVASEESHLVDRFRAPLNVLDHFRTSETRRLSAQNHELKAFYSAVTGQDVDSATSEDTATIRMPTGLGAWLTKRMSRLLFAPTADLPTNKTA